MNQNLWISFVSGLLITIENLAEVTTIGSDSITAMPTAAASDSQPNMVLLTLAGLLAGLLLRLAWLREAPYTRNSCRAS